MPTVNLLNVARQQLVEAKNMSFPNWVMISRASELTGYSEDAIRHKVKNGTWPKVVSGARRQTAALQST